MADVTIKYRGEDIATMDASGTKTLATSGKYCEGDVQVVYADPEKPTQSKTVTPTASGFTVSPDSGKVLSSVVVNGDADLVPANIRKDVDIFGVVGTMNEGITPSGTKSITENGTYDVANFASAIVNVPTGMTNLKQWIVTVPSRVVGNSATIDLVASDTDLATHRADESLVVAIEAVDINYTSGVANVNTALQSNRTLGGVNNFHGITGRKTTSDALGVNNISVRFTANEGDGGVGRMIIDSNGRLNWKSGSTTYGIDAGTYRITAWW